MPTNAQALPIDVRVPTSAVTLTDAASADSLYREGAVLFDVDQGRISWRDEHYRVVHLLPGANLVVAYGAGSTSLDSVARLLERWGLPVWTAPGTASDDLRARLRDVDAANFASGVS